MFHNICFYWHVGIVEYTRVGFRLGHFTELDGVYLQYSLVKFKEQGDMKSIAGVCQVFVCEGSQ